MPAASLRLMAHMDSKLAYWGACHDAAASTIAPEEASSAAAEGAATNAAEGAAPSSSASHPVRPGERLLLTCRGFAEGSGWVLASREGGRQLLASMGSLPTAESTLPGAVAAAHKLGLQVIPGLAGLP